MNEKKMRIWAEFQALHDELLRLLPPAEAPAPNLDTSEVVLRSDADVDRAIDLFARQQAKLQEYRAMPWE
jgi:hypothetical protein